MIPVGRICELTIHRKTTEGLYLRDAFDEEVLLDRYPETTKPGERLRVFILPDPKGEKVAVYPVPAAQVNEFAYLKVVSETAGGVYLDWGIENRLFAPKGIQSYPMREGSFYFVRVFIDHQTERIVASNNIERFLDQRKPRLETGQEVELVIWEKTKLGYRVFINHRYEGMVFHSDIFQPVKPGQKVRGYVKKVRDDEKIDLTLQPLGYSNFNDRNTGRILQALKDHGGELPLTDNSSPEMINEQFQMSKKAFKKAVGALYKARKIELLENSIRLVE